MNTYAVLCLDTRHDDSLLMLSFDGRGHNTPYVSRGET